MKVLITGSSGFIGKYIVDECLKKGYEINTLTRNAKLKAFNQHLKMLTL